MDLDSIKGLDIYLLDQLLKGRINKEQRVLDAGCGNGRNFRPLLKDGYDIHGFDPNNDVIQDLQKEFSSELGRFKAATIENFSFDDKFDVVICNAVLHFAKDKAQFEGQFFKLTSFLNDEGMLFIRMTSNIGIENQLKIDDNGLCKLPDGTTRYLLTRQKVDELLVKHALKLIEPVKTVNVDGLRCMTTLVLESLK